MLEQGNSFLAEQTQCTRINLSLARWKTEKDLIMTGLRTFYQQQILRRGLKGLEELNSNWNKEGWSKED